MTNHSINTLIAENYGIKGAIFINAMVDWTRINAANNDNFHEGRYWICGTYDSLGKYFTYFKTDSIKRIIESCFNQGLIMKAKGRISKTNWYALSDKALYDLNLDRTCLKQSLHKGQ